LIDRCRNDRRVDDDQAPRHLVPLVAKEEENGMHDHFEFSIEQLGTIVFFGLGVE